MPPDGVGVEVRARALALVRARVGRLHGWLWRRSGNSRVGCVKGMVNGLDERVVLVRGFLEQVCLKRWRARWGDGRRRGGKAQVVQNPDHCGGRCDQRQQDHLGLARGTQDAIDSYGSFEQAGPG